MKRVANCTERTKKRKRAAAYRSAARMIEMDSVAGGWSCWALELALGVPLHGSASHPTAIHPDVIAYEDMYRPDSKSLYPHRWGEAFDDPYNCRVLALCFMAAMVEAGDA